MKKQNPFLLKAQATSGSQTKATSGNTSAKSKKGKSPSIQFLPRGKTAETATPLPTLSTSRKRSSKQAQGSPSTTRTRKKSSKRITGQGRAKFAWIKEGMRVCVTWPYERHLGNGHGEHVGR